MPTVQVPPLPTPRAPREYFPETGHIVDSPFLDYFLATGGTRVYGFPLTEGFVDQKSGVFVQYFEKARFEWHPGSLALYSVRLGLLGVELNQATPATVAGFGDLPAGDCLYFPETGHNLCGLFLEYWRAKGNIERFGFPITEFRIEDGLLVQWFERTRMEWHPERPLDRRVELTKLGLRYLDVFPLCNGDPYGSLCR